MVSGHSPVCLWLVYCGSPVGLRGVSERSLGKSLMGLCGRGLREFRAVFRRSLSNLQCGSVYNPRYLGVDCAYTGLSLRGLRRVFWEEDLQKVSGKSPGILWCVFGESLVNPRVSSKVSSVLQVGSDVF